MTAVLPPLSIQTSLSILDLYSDSRFHGYQGPTRNVRFQRATPSGGGAIAKSEDGTRCAVAGKESLRIMRLSDPSQPFSPEYKSSSGRGGHRIDASRNLWDGSGLKIDSASTDVAWGHGLFNNKIMTSARNGELIMWDLNKSGSTKFERRTKDHIRSIHAMSVSHIVQHYCITGSADGHMRVWDLRDMSRSLMRVHHPTSVRSVVFSPSLWSPLQAVVGLDNGSIYRWDLKMGQRGQLDRLSVAHTSSCTALDWCITNQSTGAHSAGSITDGPGVGLGWLVSGGLDRCVKVWDLTTHPHIPHKPTYVLHPSFPVRRVLWRPSYNCELAVVSNADFASGSSNDLMMKGGAQGKLTRPTSALGLDVMMNPAGVQQMGSPAAAEGKAGGGDAVEIWDVRRGWIAKWSVTGSAIEGGVNDIAFGDSHAIWAHHPSGMFSQIDLRDSTSPLDSVPRAAATWEASESLAFVADKKARWELPYDDIRPEQRSLAEERKFKLKNLGDNPHVPHSQYVGTYSGQRSSQDLEVFSKLARRYVLGGVDRKTTCVVNAEIAFAAGQERAAQTWLLMGASLTDMVSESPPTTSDSPPLKASLAHSVSAPAALPYSFPPSPTVVQKLAMSSGNLASTDTTPKIPQRSSSTSTPRKLTPTSSTASSPRHAPSPLPPLTPRYPSFFGRRESVDSGVARRSSLYRRPSTSAPSNHSASPSDKSAASLRHVGEGALDDSDSSSESGKGDFVSGTHSSEEEGHESVRPMASPALATTRVLPVPSPLSRVAGQQQWTEDEGGEDKDDEDEASSPSPGSTDTESSESNSSRHRSKSAGKSISKRTSSRIKSRSRSSTVASLAAPIGFHTLAHQDSYSSIRTVIAGEVSFRDSESASGLKTEETLRDVRSGHGRQKSQGVSEYMPDEDLAEVCEETDVKRDSTKMTDRRVEIVHGEEKRIREMGWDALREALEHFADEGDVQMCAMLCIIAPRELRVSKKRISRFLDSYIELLTRRRLHVSSAYLRKYSEVDDINNATLVETTVYTTCGKCRKPLVTPAGPRIPGEKAQKGGYSFCMSCRSSCVECAICRLPVRALFFQCSICAHGGHQACYNSYYMQRPMVNFTTTALPSGTESRSRPFTNDSPSRSFEDDAGSTMSSTFSSSTVDLPNHDRSPVGTIRPVSLSGHPCAAGCGHYCWATNGNHEYAV